LGARFSDRDPRVAARAKELAIRLLRSAIRMGIGEQALTTVTAGIPALSDGERVLLRKKLDDIRTHDTPYLDDAGIEHLAALEALLAPRSFGERVHQRVGVWGPVPLRERDDELDEELAREGVGQVVGQRTPDDVPMRAELPWLVSGGAQRAHVFAY